MADLRENGKLEVPRDPELSERGNRIIAEELRQATGADDVELHGRRQEEREPPAGSAPPSADASSSRLLIAIVAGLGLVVCAVFGLLTGSWVALMIAVFVLLVALALVSYLILSMTTSVDKPSPGAVAALEDEGVADAEQRLNEELDEATADDDDEDRDAPAAERPARAADEQREATTPTAQPSEAVPDER